MLNFIESRAPLWIYMIYISIYIMVCAYGILYIYRNRLFKDKRNYPAVFFLIFYCVFAVFYCINSDYFSYRNWVYGNLLSQNNSGEEMVYTYLAHFVKGNYELFRLIIWGGAIILTALISKVIKVPVFFTLLIWFILYSSKVCYARASLAMAIYFFGIVIMGVTKKREMKIIGLAICLSSLLFHREMIVGIIILPIILFPIDKFLYVFFSALILIITVLIDPDMLHSFDDIEVMEEYSEKILNQTEGISEGRYDRETLKNILSACWNYSTIYIPFLIVTTKLIPHRKYLPLYIKFLYELSFGIILIATCLCIKMGFGNIFFYRVLFMLTIPLSILITYSYKYKYVSKIIVVRILLWTIMYHLLYRYTNLSAHGDI